MQTHSRGRVDLVHPDASQIRLHDIAEHLSRIGRFNGAVIVDNYSVAQHSSMCAFAARILNADTGTCMMALLHDAHEAYMGDITTPMKEAIRYVSGHSNALKMISDGLDAAIFQALLGRHYERVWTTFDRGLVKDVDAWMTGYESRVFLDGGPRLDWRFRPPEIKPLEQAFGATLAARSPLVSSRNFIGEFNLFMNKLDQEAKARAKRSARRSPNKRTAKPAAKGGASDVRRGGRRHTTTA